MKKTILDYLEKTVNTFPEKPAFVGEEGEVSFKEFYDRAKSIGSYLSKEGIYAKPIVVFMRKSPQMINTFFGIVFGGCFYVPVDEEMPISRIQTIIDACKSDTVICDGYTMEQGALLSAKNVFNYENLWEYPHDEEALYGIHEKCIDTDPIYIVFTSGSTGVPKGVIASHRSVIDYVENLSEVLGFDENTVFGNQSPLYFDACLKEIFPTLMFGATTYLIPRSLFSTPAALVEYLNKNRINTICWVVSALVMISAFNTFSDIVPKYLKTIAFGSEVFPIKQYRIWRKTLKDTRFFNLYGPTEATGMSCYYRCSDEAIEENVIPIGRPFDNTRILLIDENGQPADEGREGEIYIQGTCVTLGYYKDSENTDRAFVQNPLHNDYPELVYKTGDVARFDQDGNLVFVSRRDYQIKHMGHRIELGEIEADAAKVENVGLCACVYDEKKDFIILYYNGTVSAAELSRALKEMLPRYMIPNRIKHIDEMPLTPNGKLDRKALKERK